MNRFENRELEKPKEDTISIQEQEISVEQQKEIVIETGEKRRTSLLYKVLESNITKNIAEFTPFLGDAKQIGQAVFGRKLMGEEMARKLSGKERLIDAATGAALLAVDVFSLGEGGEILRLTGKALPLIEKTAAVLLEKGAIGSAKILGRTAEYMAQHPELVTKAEEYIESQVRLKIKNLRQRQHA